MTKIESFALLWFIIIATASLNAHGREFGPEAVERWFERLPNNGEEKMTKLHFYYHERFSGKNQTSYEIAKANVTNNSTTLFGSLVMMDSPLKVGPDPNSTIVGRAQGIDGSASSNEFALLMAINLVFTQGEYNGSTLSVLGRNPIFNRYREMAVVGGSGVFRQARGVATLRTHSRDGGCRV